MILLALCLAVQFCSAQFHIDSLAMDSAKEVEKYKPVEAGFLFSYYEQDGTKSPVTGGIGNEALQDRVWNVILNIPINRKIDFSFLGGMDVYSSASTDFINNEYGLYAETSASYSDQRIYGTLGIVQTNEKKRNAIGGGLGVSHEYDVKSYNLFASFRKQSKNRNTVYFFKSSYYWDFWTLYYPDELRWKYLKSSGAGDNGSDGSQPSDLRTSFNGTLTIEQDISARMNAALTAGITYQDGLLSTPFHRVYFNNTFVHDIEKLPRHRLKVPIGLHLNYYFNKYLISRVFYRYYFDDFGIKAHTASVEFPVRLWTPLTLAPFYRYHTQTASNYFQPFGFHSVDDRYFTSDYDLSDIASNRIGFEIKYAPFIMKKKTGKTMMFKKVTLRASKYFRLRQEELILKSYLVALSLNFRIE